MRRFLLLVILAFAPLMMAQEATEHGKSEAAQPEEVSSTWKWANFIILAIGLGYLMGKSLPGMFHSRNQEIQKGIAEAQKLKYEAEKRVAEMDARMNALGAEIERFRAQAATEMQQEGERIRQETAAQIQRIEAQVEQEIESATKAARRNLKDYAANLALELAEQRVRTRLDGNAENNLVDGFIRDLEHQGSKN